MSVVGKEIVRLFSGEGRIWQRKEGKNPRYDVRTESRGYNFPRRKTMASDHDSVCKVSDSFVGFMVRVP